MTGQDLATPITGLAAPRTLDELLQRIDAERTRGYSLASQEVEIGLTSVGMPVRGRTGEIIAVINISGPSSRLITRVDEIARRLHAAQAHCIPKGPSHPFARTYSSSDRTHSSAASRDVP